MRNQLSDSVRFFTRFYISPSDSRIPVRTSGYTMLVVTKHMSDHTYPVTSFALNNDEHCVSARIKISAREKLNRVALFSAAEETHENSIIVLEISRSDRCPHPWTRQCDGSARKIGPSMGHLDFRRINRRLSWLGGRRGSARVPDWPTGFKPEATEQVLGAR